MSSEQHTGPHLPPFSWDTVVQTVRMAEGLLYGNESLRVTDGDGSF